MIPEHYTRFTPWYLMKFWKNGKRVIPCPGKYTVKPLKTVVDYKQRTIVHYEIIDD